MGKDEECGYSIKTAADKREAGGKKALIKELPRLSFGRSAAVDVINFN